MNCHNEVYERQKLISEHKFVKTFFFYISGFRHKLLVTVLISSSTSQGFFSEMIYSKRKAVLRQEWFATFQSFILKNST